MHRDNVPSDFFNAILAQLSFGPIIYYHQKCRKRAWKYLWVFKKRTVAEERGTINLCFYFGGWGWARRGQNFDCAVPIRAEGWDVVFYWVNWDEKEVAFKEIDWQVGEGKIRWTSDCITRGGLHYVGVSYPARNLWKNEPWQNAFKYKNQIVRYLIICISIFFNLSRHANNIFFIG